ncbi:hypothetical protein GUJ93_ZPchr0002g24276 [Zizania palustris]|uniref:Uncharacterized protein n=1 Tax=Zizania palustris TaxID=103762 RepID=A0A8J5V5J6_ZIZPA|nr:hypothetical protein GUJ93_ZPchr0002g24276 [Zizania palustris]
MLAARIESANRTHPLLCRRRKWYRLPLRQAHLPTPGNLSAESLAKLEYLEECRIKDQMKKHYEFISYPISLWAEKTTEKEFSDDEDEEEKDAEEGNVEDVDEEKEEKEKKKNKIKEVSHEWSLVNKDMLIWMMN